MKRKIKLALILLTALNSSAFATKHGCANAEFQIFNGFDSHYPVVFKGGSPEGPTGKWEVNIGSTIKPTGGGNGVHMLSLSPCSPNNCSINDFSLEVSDANGVICTYEGSISFHEDSKGICRIQNQLTITQIREGKGKCKVGDSHPAMGKVDYPSLDICQDCF